MPPSLREKLDSWLSESRSRRCRILEGTQDAPEAGVEGTFEIKMAAGQAADLDYLRGARETPSPVSTFTLQASAAAGESKSSWSGEVKKTLDDVAGSPRVRLAWGPVTRSGEHVLFVSLGGKQIPGCPCRVRVRPRATTHSEASTLHAFTESSPPQHMPLTKASGEPARPLPPLNTLRLSACQAGGLFVIARDKYGNRRDAGGDSFFLVVKYQGSKRQRHAAAGRDDATGRGQAADSGGSEAAVRIDDASDFITVNDGSDGGYGVRFSRAQAGEYTVQVSSPPQLSPLFPTRPHPTPTLAIVITPTAAHPSHSYHPNRRPP